MLCLLPCLSSLILPLVLLLSFHLSLAHPLALPSPSLTFINHTLQSAEPPAACRLPWPRYSQSHHRTTTARRSLAPRSLQPTPFVPPLRDNSTTSALTGPFNICREITRSTLRRVFPPASASSSATRSVSQEPLFIPSSGPPTKRYGLAITSTEKPTWVGISQYNPGNRFHEWLAFAGEPPFGGSEFVKTESGMWQGWIVFQNRFGRQSVDMEVHFEKSVRRVEIGYAVFVFGS